MLNKLTVGFFILLVSLLTGCGESPPPAPAPEVEESVEVMEVTEGSDVPTETEDAEEADEPEASEPEGSEETDSADGDSY
ncbi:hypothetical protein C9J03_26005 [Photobacterium gaetbulicola]|uniref:Uncharacterized protein n=1 Tax=Photobacterium gaetbulicola TaxID=1295392 RepID=A0A0B9GRS7_9GAMM|nr:hypothetical protein [Photobacterium gaetbulicola]KHT61486.1 hypothetical protein RJ45_22550 [Photobacterium gaetbulicola]PST98930.1 hypothetical protein C9J03_26005 [Photobacterium gaetbulicola]